MGRLFKGGWTDTVLKEKNNLDALTCTEIISTKFDAHGIGRSPGTTNNSSSSLTVINPLAGSIGMPEFELTGTLLPVTHTLKSLVEYCKENIKGMSHTDHNVSKVANECKKWFPRPEEYERYVNWDETDPSKYTRNLVYNNAAFDCLLMCWPPGCKSSIHCHDQSSCWAVLVDGEVVEVQYAPPTLDKRFIESEMKDPTGAIGRCGELKFLRETKLCAATPVAYANNDIGIHRIENRSTSKPAYTLHIYAPGLDKIKIFRESGAVWIHQMSAIEVDETDTDPYSSQESVRIDVAEWNRVEKA